MASFGSFAQTYHTPETRSCLVDRGSLPCSALWLVFSAVSQVFLNGSKVRFALCITKETPLICIHRSGKHSRTSAVFTECRNIMS